MATVTARNVDDREYALFAEVAAENGRSVSEELRRLIGEQARKRRARKLVEELAELRRQYPITLADGMTSLDLLREERDSW